MGRNGGAIPGPDGHIFEGQFRRASIFAGLSSYPMAHTTDISARSTWGPLFGLSLCVVLGSERARSGELPKDNSSSSRGLLSPMRMGYLPLFGRTGGARWTGPFELSTRLVSRWVRKCSFSCCRWFACSRNSVIYLACFSCFASIS